MPTNTDYKPTQQGQWNFDRDHMTLPDEVFIKVIANNGYSSDAGVAQRAISLGLFPDRAAFDIHMAEAKEKHTDNGWGAPINKVIGDNIEWAVPAGMATLTGLGLAGYGVAGGGAALMDSAAINAGVMTAPTVMPSVGGAGTMGAWNGPEGYQGFEGGQMSPNPLPASTAITPNVNPNPDLVDYANNAEWGNVPSVTPGVPTNLANAPLSSMPVAPPSGNPSLPSSGAPSDGGVPGGASSLLPLATLAGSQALGSLGQKGILDELKAAQDQQNVANKTGYDNWTNTLADTNTQQQQQADQNYQTYTGNVQDNWQTQMGATQGAYDQYLNTLNPPEDVKQSRIALNEKTLIPQVRKAADMSRDNASAAGWRGPENTAAREDAIARDEMNARQLSALEIMSQYNVPGQMNVPSMQSITQPQMPTPIYPKIPYTQGTAPFSPNYSDMLMSGLGNVSAQYTASLYQ